MRIGLEISSFTVYNKTIVVMIHLPLIQFGYFHDHYADGDRWGGIKIEIPNEISFEKYDYGLIFKFRILGFGLEVTKVFI
jgi:hypothetical protein